MYSWTTFECHSSSYYWHWRGNKRRPTPRTRAFLETVSTDSRTQTPAALAAEVEWRARTAVFVFDSFVNLAVTLEIKLRWSTIYYRVRACCCAFPGVFSFSFSLGETLTKNDSCRYTFLTPFFEVKEQEDLMSCSFSESLYSPVEVSPPSISNRSHLVFSVPHLRPPLLRKSHISFTTSFIIHSSSYSLCFLNTPTPRPPLLHSPLSPPFFPLIPTPSPPPSPPSSPPLLPPH